MNRVNTYQHSGPGPLEIRELAQFDAALGDLPEAEKRRKRIAYLREAFRQAQAGIDMMKKSGCILIPFAIIPIFWPVLWFARAARRKMEEQVQAQVRAALDYWNLAPNDLTSEAQNPL